MIPRTRLDKLQAEARERNAKRSHPGPKANRPREISIDWDRTRRRLFARALLKRGWTPAMVADEVGHSVADVVRWIELGCPLA